MTPAPAAALVAAFLLSASAPASASVTNAAGAVEGTDRNLVAACSFVRTPAGVVVTGVAESPLAANIWLRCTVRAGGVTETFSEFTGLPVAYVHGVATLPGVETTVCVQADSDWTVDVQEHVRETCRTL